MSDPINTVNPVITVRLEGTTEILRLLRRHPERIGRTMTSLVKQEARGLAVELARNTFPHGFKEKARMKGEERVANAARRVFATPSKVFDEMQISDPAAANSFWANIQNRRFARAQTALQTSNSAWNNLRVGRLDSSLHKWQKRSDSKPKQVVTSEKSLDNHIKRKQRRVGFAKGTWIQAAKAIGGRVRGTAQWVTRHKQAPGTAVVKTGDNASVTLTNDLSYIYEVTTDGAVHSALKVAHKRLILALQRSMNEAANKTHKMMKRRRKR